MYYHKHEIYVNKILAKCLNFPFLLDNTFGFTSDKSKYHNLISTYTLNTNFNDIPVDDDLSFIDVETLDELINTITVD